MPDFYNEYLLMLSNRDAEIFLQLIFDTHVVFYNQYKEHCRDSDSITDDKEAARLAYAKMLKNLFLKLGATKYRCVAAIIVVCRQ